LAATVPLLPEFWELNGTTALSTKSRRCPNTTIPARILSATGTEASRPAPHAQ
jgi:hypothetical protein